MPRLRYLTAAQNDILAILDYIQAESGSSRAAGNFASRIRRRCRNLATLPGRMGRPRPELGPDLRSVAFQGYIIFFRYEGEVLEVVNVLEGHRDIDAHFNKEG